MVSIFVEDNGSGFNDRCLEQILQPFNRLHRNNEYEGNNLAIVEKIVARHQGQINARSQPGEGSTFIITLPKKQTE